MISIYVSVNGNDENDGLSENNALKTLKKAIERAKRGSVKRITIIGTLSGKDEGSSSYSHSAFTIKDSGAHEIIISGIKDETIKDKTSLNGLIINEKEDRWGNTEEKEMCINIITVIGNSNIKFENIRISNYEVEVEERNGIGLIASGKNCKVILGDGVEICNNTDSGVVINEGAKVIVSGAKIYNNVATEGGGLCIRDGDCILEKGDISKNEADYGAGVFLDYKDGYIDDVIKPFGSKEGIHKPYPKKYYCLSGNLQVFSGNIFNNTAKYTGGGVYISNGAIFANKSGRIYANECKEENGKDIFIQKLSGIFNVTGKIFTHEDQVKYLTDIISECKNIPEKFNNDKELIEKEYTNYCQKKSKEIIDMYESNKTDHNYKMLNIVNIYLISFWNYITSINKTKNNTFRTLNNLLYSTIKKFTLIVQLMENEDYENGLIVFRSFYESIIITEFLSFHQECIEPFEQFSFLRLKNKLSKDILEKNVAFQQIYNEIKNEYSNDIKKDYIWTQSVINKAEITLLDIAETIFENSDLTKEMYRISSELLHSNTGILNAPEFNDILSLILLKYMKIFGVPFIIKTFYDVYHESNYFDVNIFLRIIEFVLELGYNYKINIR